MIRFYYPYLNYFIYMVDEVQSIDNSHDIFEILGPNELWEYIQLHGIQFQYSKSQGETLKLEVMSYWEDMLHQILRDTSMNLRGLLLNYYTIKNRERLTPISQDIKRKEMIDRFLENPKFHDFTNIQLEILYNGLTMLFSQSPDWGESKSTEFREYIHDKIVALMRDTGV